MQKIILILTFMSLTFSSISQVDKIQNWIKVTITNDGDTVYINDTFVKKGGVYGIDDGVIRVWTKMIFPVYDLKLNGKSKKYKNAVLKTLGEYDCNNQKTRTITHILYSSDGKVIYNGDNQENEENWTFVVPESVGETILNSICKLFN